MKLVEPPMLKRVLLISLAVLLAIIVVPSLLIIFAFSVVIYPVLWLFDEVSGENAWQRRQRHYMECERPRLADAEFLRAEGIGETDGLLWLAVRRAIAESVGLPCENIYADDKLADLWRMQSLGPDLMDLVFRMERSLGVRIRRGSVKRLSIGVRYGQEGEFRQFAAVVVGELRESVKAGAA